MTAEPSLPPLGDTSDLLRFLRDMNPGGVLFDLDGTLVDSGDANHRALAQAWAAQGATLDPDWYRARTGLSVDGLAEAWTAAHAGHVDGPAAAERFVEFSALDAPSAWLFPDTVALLRHCADVVPVGLVTNNFRPIVDALLAAHLGDVSFGAIVTADTPGIRPKPAPDPYRLASELLGLRARDCVAVEDSDEGLHSALTAGLMVVDVRQFR